MGLTMSLVGKVRHLHCGSTSKKRTKTSKRSMMRMTIRIGKKQVKVVIRRNHDMTMTPATIAKKRVT